MALGVGVQSVTRCSVLLSKRTSLPCTCRCNRRSGPTAGNICRAGNSTQCSARAISIPAFFNQPGGSAVLLLAAFHHYLVRAAATTAVLCSGGICKSARLPSELRAAAPASRRPAVAPAARWGAWQGPLPGRSTPAGAEGRGRRVAQWRPAKGCGSCVDTARGRCQ